VFDGNSAELQRQGSSAEVFKFIHVRLEGKAQFPGAGEDLLCLCQIEGIVLTEHINERQRTGVMMVCPPIFQIRQHFSAHQPGVSLCASFIFRGNRVSRHERGCDLQRTFGVQLQQHFQLGNLGVPFQPVAGLGFSGGGTVAEHRQRTLTGLRVQLLRQSLARGAHRGVDPATGCHDLHVGTALQARFKFGGAVARPHQVGVRVHQARHHDPALRIQPFLIRVAGEKVPAGADRDNAVAGNEHSSVFNDP